MLQVRFAPSQGMAGRLVDTFLSCWLLSVRPAASERLHWVPLRQTGSRYTHRGCWVPSVRLAPAWPTLHGDERQKGCQLCLLRSQRMGWGPFWKACLGRWPPLVWASPGMVHPAQTCRRGGWGTAGLASVGSAPGRGHATPKASSHLSSRIGRWLHSPGQAAPSAQPQPWLRPSWQLRLPAPEHAWLRSGPDW